MTMDVLHGNQRVLAMIARHWPTARTGHAPDYVSIEIRLQRAADTTFFASPAPASGPAAAARTSCCAAAGRAGRGAVAATARGLYRSPTPRSHR